LEDDGNAIETLPGRAHPGANALTVHAGRMVARMLDLVGECAAGGCAEEKQEAQRQRGGNSFECRSCAHLSPSKPSSANHAAG
jgi:hypothetical protein